tara:strand:+ start:72 stop:461 length:390 start_codon:yes stop_codon:yes gene_type:complete
MLIKKISLSVGGQENYCPHPADKAGLARRRNATKYKIPPERVEFIRLLIEHDWSPEQISGVLKTSGMPVSHEWIYQFIADDKAPGGRLYRHFRQGKRVQAEAIKNVVSIDERATIVDSREPFGDWERPF